MVIQLVRYLVPSGQEPAFEETLREAAQVLARSSHCLGYSLTRATLERNRYVFSIFWDSADGHQIAFQQSAEFQAYQECLAPFATMTEEDQHYRRTGVELTRPMLVRLSGRPKE